MHSLQAPVYDETATYDAKMAPSRRGPLAGARLGVLRANVGVALGVTVLNARGTTTVSGEVPSPLFTNRPRPASPLERPGLKRQEFGVHLPPGLRVSGRRGLPHSRVRRSVLVPAAPRRADVHPRRADLRHAPRGVSPRPGATHPFRGGNHGLHDGRSGAGHRLRLQRRARPDLPPDPPLRGRSLRAVHRRLGRGRLPRRRAVGACRRRAGPGSASDSDSEALAGIELPPSRGDAGIAGGQSRNLASIDQDP